MASRSSLGAHVRLLTAGNHCGCMTRTRVFLMQRPNIVDKCLGLPERILAASQY